jgi:hypothetical protein
VIGLPPGAGRLQDYKRSGRRYEAAAGTSPYRRMVAFIRCGSYEPMATSSAISWK